MVLRHVQPREVVIVVFDLGAFKDFETHTGKDVDHLILHQRQGMKPAQRHFFPRQGDVHLLPAVPGDKLQFIHLRAQALVLVLHHYLELVDHLAHGRPVFLGDSAQALHQVRNGALLPQEILPECSQFLFVIDLADPLHHLLLQRLDPLLHDHLSLIN